MRRESASLLSSQKMWRSPLGFLKNEGILCLYKHIMFSKHRMNQLISVLKKEGITHVINGNTIHINSDISVRVEDGSYSIILDELQFAETKVEDVVFIIKNVEDFQSGNYGILTLLNRKGQNVPIDEKV
jgi:hypothetical protein